MNAQPGAFHPASPARVSAPTRALAFLTSSGGLLLLGGMFNIIVVATGLRDVASVPILAAFALAGILLLLQYFVGSKVAGNGWLGLGYVGAYAVLMTVNVVLATGGVTSIGFANRLGQVGFERSVSDVTPQIAAVADAYRSISASLESLSVYSAGRAATEAHDGRTCGASDPGEGPVFRLRMRDRDDFAALSQTFSRLSGQMSGARGQVDTLVSGYQVDRHEEIVRGVNQALATARDGALNPALSSMRRQLSSRLTGVSSGVQDTQSATVVVCPDDQLMRELEAVLRSPVPEVPQADDLPARPSHNMAVFALIEHVAAAMRGRGFDWSLWGMPLLLGFLPDAIFMLGLAQARRDRRKLLGIAGALSADLPEAGSGWEALAAAATRAAGNEVLHRLASFHHRRVRLFGVTDYLVIPAGKEHLSDYLIAQRIKSVGYASYVGIGPAGRLDPVARPGIEPDNAATLSHFFLFRKGAWDKLLLDALHHGRPRNEFADEPAVDEPPVGEHG
ncbi:MAG: hypothetical protein QOH47_2509 [Sphingomonadales bacterium]|jgi:hypothetical protein|nr:hypothetical protein [Sphingomonadales bacterium]